MSSSGVVLLESSSLSSGLGQGIVALESMEVSAGVGCSSSSGNRSGRIGAECVLSVVGFVSSSTGVLVLLSSLSGVFVFVLVVVSLGEAEDVELAAADGFGCALVEDEDGLAVAIGSSGSAAAAGPSFLSLPKVTRFFVTGFSGLSSMSSEVLCFRLEVGCVGSRAFASELCDLVKLSGSPFSVSVSGSTSGK